MSPQSLSHPDQRLRGNPDIAVAYLRTATGTEGLVAQRATLSAWAEKHGVRIVEWCEDVASSGLTELKDRPGLRAALAALSRHQAGHLAIARRDRLSRDVLLAACFEQIVFRAGAIVSMPDPG